MMVPTESVQFGERRREDYGDIDALAASIARYGLLHPIVVDAECRLVTGGRRLKACERLGWTEIEARDFGELTEEERREIELEENLRRKDLTPYEQARELVRKAPVVADAIASKSEAKVERGEKRHYAAPKADVAEALGVSTGALVQAEQHVAAAEAFPFMQRPDWRQSQVLEAREHLQKIGPDRVPFLTEMLSEPGVPPRTAVAVLANVAEMPPEQVDEIGRLYASPDPRDKSLAKTKAAKIEPRADPRSLIIARCMRDLQHCIEMVPDGELTGAFRDCVCRLDALRAAVLAEHEERINA